MYSIYTPRNESQLTLINVSSLQQVQMTLIFGVRQHVDRVTVKVFAGFGFLCFMGRGFFCTTALHVVVGDVGESTDSVEVADDTEPAKKIEAIFSIS